MLSNLNLILKTQNREELSLEEMSCIVNGYTSGKITDNQMSCWLEAVYKNGMTYQETLNYTKIMLYSGTKLNFSHLNGFVIDKHSTGGVGDKVSIVLAPLLAACGCFVPMLAGRGLEHTGGTIDKLESIIGYNTSLDLDNFSEIVENVGVSIMSQTNEICPADKKIYSLRDYTGTVSSLPLICGSIMSKKIAAGIEGLILDIKVGNGAFMTTIDKAKELGDLLTKVGKLYGLNIIVCFTDMNQPLGKSAGLWCEIIECLECLKGNGPIDLMKVVFYLGEKALELARFNSPREHLLNAIKDGSALKKFKDMIKAHGGSIDSLENTNTNKPKYIKTIYAEKDGYINFMNTKDIGNILVNLGAGRSYKDERLDPTAGIIFHKKMGDFVSMGDPIMEYFCSNKCKFNNIFKNLSKTVIIKNSFPIIHKIIYT